MCLSLQLNVRFNRTNNSSLLCTSPSFYLLLLFFILPPAALIPSITSEPPPFRKASCCVKDWLSACRNLACSSANTSLLLMSASRAISSRSVFSEFSSICSLAAVCIVAFFCSESRRFFSERSFVSDLS